MSGVKGGIDPFSRPSSYLQLYCGSRGYDVTPEVIQKIAFNVMSRNEPQDEPIWVMEE